MKNHLIIVLLLLIAAHHAQPAGAAPATTAAPIARNLHKGVTTVRLDNGLTVLLNENHTQPLVSVQVWVKTGSINETPATAGLSHFLEHLIFKGTEKYPGDAISRKVETQGGSINAGTSKEFTHFYIDIQKEAAGDAVRILADAMANAALPAEDIERERPVVVEEIQRHGDNPHALLYDLFNEALFPTTPYRHSIIGTADIIKNVSRDAIKAYYQEHYVPENMVLSIAGDFDMPQIRSLVQETFGAQQARKALPDPQLIEPPHPSVQNQQAKDVEHTYWLGGCIGPDISSDDQFAADIASTILGGGRSSRLFARLREREQLVYSISASFWSQRGSGIFAVSAVYSPEKDQAVMAAIAEEINRLADDGPTAAELSRAREMIRSQWYFGLETFHDQAAVRGYWQMQGVPGMIDLYIDKMEKVSGNDVQQFLKKYYQPYGLSGIRLYPETSPTR